MHTREPLFSGSVQFYPEMQKIVKVCIVLTIKIMRVQHSMSHSYHQLLLFVQLLGMIPEHMLEQSNDQHRRQILEKTRFCSSGTDERVIIQERTLSTSPTDSALMSAPSVAHVDSSLNVGSLVGFTLVQVSQCQNGQSTL